MFEDNIFAELNVLPHFSILLEIITIYRVIDRFRAFSFIPLMYRPFKIGPEAEFEKGSFGKISNF
jgi:hypothetical protein